MKFKIYNNSGIYRLDSERGKSRIYEIINKSQPKKIKKLFTKATDVDIPRGCYNFYIKNYTLSFSFIYSGIEYLFDFLHKIINHNISLLVTLEDAGSYIYVVTIPIDDNKVRLIFLDRKETNYRNSQKRYYDTELKNTVVVCDILINKYELVKQFNQEFHKIYDENKYYLSKEYVELCIKNKEKICQEYSLRMRHEHDLYARFQNDYPAHLHIDCLPGYTGLGIGSQLIETMADDLKDEVNGVMLGVSKTNQGAINFYQKHDFDILDEDNAGYVMGRQLKKTTEYGLDGCNDAIHK